MKLLVVLALTAKLVPAIYDMELTQTNRSPYNYLALGDSYTIGESVEAEGSFPYQLAAELTKAKHPISKPDIIATTGWTTDELIDAISKSDTKDKKYDLVTLLIGVNNQYRGYNQETYRAEFIQLLNTAIAHANGNKNRVFVLSIPDWGVTPFADGRDRSQIAYEIDLFNAINKQETQKAGVAYIDITPISKQAAIDPTLNAEDGLHPSAKMYGLWVKEVLPVVEKGLK
jgi:lysophospholipase L1-like esterase